MPRKSYGLIKLGKTPGTTGVSFMYGVRRASLRRRLSPPLARSNEVIFSASKATPLPKLSISCLPQRDVASKHCASLATTDRLSFAAPSPLVQETADGVIQVLGSRRSRLSTHDAIALQNIPRYVVLYIHAVARKNGVVPQTLEREVMDYLVRCAVLSPGQPGVLFADCALLCPSRGAILRLSAVPPGPSAPLRQRVCRVPCGSRPTTATGCGRTDQRLLQLPRQLKPEPCFV